MNSAVKYGAILGVVGVVITTILYVMGPEVMFGTVGSIGNLVISIGLFVYFAIQLRTENGGYFTFGEAFKSLFVMGIVAGVISIVFTFVLHNYIDPGLADVVKEMTIEKSLKIYEAIGLDQDAVDNAIALLEAEEYGMTPINALKAVGYYAIFGAIGSAIVGAIIKKKKPMDLGY